MLGFAVKNLRPKVVMPSLIRGSNDLGHTPVAGEAFKASEPRETVVGGLA